MMKCNGGSIVLGFSLAGWIEPQENPGEKNKLLDAAKDSSTMTKTRKIEPELHWNGLDKRSYVC